MALSSRSQPISSQHRSLHYHKICLTGQAGVGKTSVFNRIRTGRFEQEVTTSLGMDTYEMMRTVNDRDIGVVFHDTGGQEYYGTVSQNFYRNASVVIYMFAYDDLLSLEGLFPHAEEATRYARDYCFYYLVCNKYDVQSEDVIDKQIIDSKREMLECSSVFYISALTGEGINELLSAIFNDMGKVGYADFGDSLKVSYLEERNKSGGDKCCHSN